MLFQTNSQLFKSPLFPWDSQDVLGTAWIDLDHFKVVAFEKSSQRHTPTCQLSHRSKGDREEFYPSSQEFFVAFSQMDIGSLFDGFSPRRKTQGCVYGNNLRFAFFDFFEYFLIRVNQRGLSCPIPEDAKTSRSTLDTRQVQPNDRQYLEPSLSHQMQ